MFVSSTIVTHKNVCICIYRQPIESMAVNQSLKELIDRFAKQKMQVSAVVDECQFAITQSLNKIAGIDSAVAREYSCPRFYISHDR